MTLTAARIAANILTNEKLRRIAAWATAAILSPLILLLMVICSFLSGGAAHNAAAVDLSFYGGAVTSSMPASYRQHIVEMQQGLAMVDGAVARVNGMTENGNGLDAHRVKAIFYTLYFGDGNPAANAVDFVDCFTRYEERTKIWIDEDGVEQNEVYTVAIPVSLESAYQNLHTVMGVEMTEAVRKNAEEVYERTCIGGDTFSGDYERGDDTGIDLDISAFIDAGTKNNLDLVTYVQHAWASGWGYAWGTYGMVLTEQRLTAKLTQYPDDVGRYEDFIRENWLNGRTADCVGLIKGYGWLDADTMTIRYGSNGMPDIDADRMYEDAAVKGSLSTMPDTPGLAVWHKGHIGVYVGNGEVIEAMGTRYGVVKTKLQDRGWTAWLEIPNINHITEMEATS